LNPSALLADQSLPSPLVLIAPAQGGIRIMAMNQEARAVGIDIDQLLADARALYPPLKVQDYDPDRDLRSLKRLALWFIRFSPWVAVDPPDGLLVDITGCAHLFGGEAAFAELVIRRLTGFGLSAKIALADTIGAAWAVVHHHQAQITIIPEGEIQSALANLPLTALRLSHDVSDQLSQVGLKTIAMLFETARAPLVARYGDILMTRFDQALGHKGESLSPIIEPPNYRTSLRFVEPILHLQAIETHLPDLVKALTEMLKEASLGGRKFDLTLYRVDAKSDLVSVGTSKLTHDTEMITRLMLEKLKAFSDGYDAGFGIEQLTFAVYYVERITIEQTRLVRSVAKDRERAFETLIDRVANKFGPQSVGQLVPNESHIPERSETYVLPGNDRLKGADWPTFLKTLQGDTYLGRPIMLLPRPEPITAIAEVPDGPPVVFEWRRLKCRIAQAEGPERIAPEWWSRKHSQIEQTRDYYRVEDRDGYRYWLYRQGLYERDENPNWFMHGFFA
jgi:protein ImuB